MSRNLHIITLRDPHDRHFIVWRIMDMYETIATGRARNKRKAYRNAESARDNRRMGDQGTDYT